MATKKGNNDYGRFDFDSDLDFDFDSNIPDERPKHDRKPVGHVLDGVKTSLRNKFTDKGTYAGIVRNALPEGLGKSWDVIEEGVSSTARLYDDATREMRPHLGPIARKLDALVPESAGKVKKFTKALRDKLSNEYSSSSGGQSLEDQGTSNMLLEVFGAQASKDDDIREKETARKIIDDKIEYDRFSTSLKALNSVATGVNSVKDYLTKFNVTYQKKSLELQYRSYFATAALLKSFNESRKINEATQAAILKNTGLPEYAKTNELERYKAVAKNQVFGKINQSMFGGGDRIAGAVKKIGGSLQAGVDSFKDNLFMLDGGLETMLELRQLKREQAEMMGKKHSGWIDTGEMIGSNLGNKASNMFSKFLSPMLAKNPKLMKANYVAGRFANNPGALLDKIKGNDFINNLPDKGLMGEGAKGFIDLVTSLFAASKADMNIKGVGIGSEGEDKAYTQTRKNRAVVDIIPGYLARILREIRVSRTGDEKTPLLMYDVNSDKFKDEAKLAADVMHSVRKSLDKGSFKRSSKDLFDSFADDTKMDGNHSKEIQNYLNTMSRREDFDYDGKRMMDTKEFRAMTPEARKIAAAIIRSKYEGNDLASSENKYKLTNSAMRLRGDTSDYRGEIQKHIRDGLGSSLEQYGIITRTEYGSYNINEEKYHNLMSGGESVIGVSDINKKHSIRKGGLKNGKQSLAAMLRTGVSSWKYNANVGKGNTTHVGPMAQDVRSNFGDDAAPGGKAIDLVSMNGHNMAAISALADKIDGIDSGKSIALLESIDRHIQQMATSGSGMGGGISLSGLGDSLSSGANGAKGVFGQLLAAGGGLIGGSFKAMGSTYNNILKPGVRMAKSLVGGAANVVAGQKDNLKNGASFVMDQVFSLMGKAMHFGSDMLFNKLPSAAGMVKTGLAKIKSGAIKLFNGAKDIYVEGRESPVLQASLMRFGVYKDKVTGLAIETANDLAKIKGDVIDAAGNVVLTLEQVAQGVYDSKGNKIRTIGMDMLRMAGGLVMGAGTKLKDGWNSLRNNGLTKGLTGVISGMGDSIKGVFGSVDVGRGQSHLVLTQIRDILALMKPGKKTMEILKRTTDKFKRSAGGLSGTGAGSLDAISKELDKEGPSGESTDSPSSAAAAVAAAANGEGGGQGQLQGSSMFTRMLGGAAGLGGKGLSSVTNSIGAWRNRAKGVGPMQPGKGGFFNKAMGKVSGVGGRVSNSKWGGRAMNLGVKGAGWIGAGLTAASSLIGGLTANQDANPQMVGGGEGEGGADNVPGAGNARSYASRLRDLAGDKISKAYGAVRGKFNDRNGDGSRDAGGGDRAKDMDNIRKANEERKAEALDESQARAGSGRRYKGTGSPALDKLIGAGTGLIGTLVSNSGLIFSAAKGILGKGMSIFTKGAAVAETAKAAQAASVLGKGANASRLAAGAYRGGHMAGQMVNMASKLPGVARVGMIAARVLQVGAIVAPVVGSWLMAGASAAASAISAAVSAPVTLIVAGVAVAGYGLYRLVKYLRRNKANSEETIRLNQYGLNGSEATTPYVSKILGLESYLEDGKIIYTDGKASLNDKLVKPADILELFSINKDDKEGGHKLAEWIEKRFKPFFLSHLTALYSVDPTRKLEDVNKLKKPQAIEYFSKVSGESGPYDFIISPFKGVEQLSNDQEKVNTLIQTFINRYAKDLQSAVDRHTAKGNLDPNSPNAKRLKSAIDQAKATSDKLQASKVPYKAAVPDSLKAAISGVVEDGKNPDTPSGTIQANTQGSMGSLRGAGGPLSEGTAGMQYIKLGKDAQLEGLHPRLLKHLLGMAQEYGEVTGKSFNVNEAFRTFQRQQELYRSNPNKAAKPGNSMHEFGLAVDINSADLVELEKLGLLRKYGFTRPVGGETWHIEPAGVQSNVSLAKRDPAFADLAIENSLGRGGGGVGSIKGSLMGKRNAKLAMELYNATQGPMPVLVPTSKASENGLKPPIVDPTARADTSPGNVRVGTVGSENSVSFSGEKSTSGINGGTIPSMQDGEAKPNQSAPATVSTSTSGEGATGGVPTGNTGAAATGDIKRDISTYAKEAGIDPQKMLLLSAMESGLNPNAKSNSSSATGLNQFIKTTWDEQLGKHGRKYGLAGNISPTDVRANTLLGAEYMKSSEKVLKSVKSDISFTDLYLAHFLGAEGARIFLKADPNTFGAQLLPKAAASNKSIFYSKGMPLTVGQIYSLLESRIAGKVKSFGIAYNPTGMKGATIGSTTTASTGGASPSSASMPSVSSSGPSRGLAGFTAASLGGVVNTPVPGRESANSKSQISMMGSMGSPRQDYMPDISAVSKDAGMDGLVDTAKQQLSAMNSIHSVLSSQVVTILTEISSKLGNQSGGAGQGKGGYTQVNGQGGNSNSEASRTSFDIRRKMA